MNFGLKKKVSAEYKEWLNTHKEECHANHEESSGKMKVEATTEMFSENLRCKIHEHR